LADGDSINDFFLRTHSWGRDCHVTLHSDNQKNITSLRRMPFMKIVFSSYGGFFPRIAVFDLSGVSQRPKKLFKFNIKIIKGPAIAGQ
jgi:hypothetical protein